MPDTTPISHSLTCCSLTNRSYLSQEKYNTYRQHNFTEFESIDDHACDELLPRCEFEAPDILIFWGPNRMYVAGMRMQQFDALLHGLRIGLIIFEKYGPADD